MGYWNDGVMEYVPTSPTLHPPSSMFVRLASEVFLSSLLALIL